MINKYIFFKSKQRIYFSLNTSNKIDYAQNVCMREGQIVNVGIFEVNIQVPMYFSSLTVLKIFSKLSIKSSYNIILLNAVIVDKSIFKCAFLR